MACQRTCCGASPSRFSLRRNPAKVWGWGHFWYALSRRVWEAAWCSIPFQVKEPRRRSNCRRMQTSDDIPLALVVDDDAVFRNRLCRALAQRKWESEAVPDGAEALKFARERSPDL